MIVEKVVIFVEGLHARDAAAPIRTALQRAAHQADVATLRGRLEGLSKRLAAAAKLEQEKKELHEHLAMMVLSSEQRKEDKLKELLAAMGATDVSESKYGS